VTTRGRPADAVRVRGAVRGGGARAGRGGAWRGLAGSEHPRGPPLGRGDGSTPLPGRAELRTFPAWCNRSSSAAARAAGGGAGGAATLADLSLWHQHPEGPGDVPSARSSQSPPATVCLCVPRQVVHLWPHSSCGLPGCGLTHPHVRAHTRVHTSTRPAPAATLVCSFSAVAA
jgi:hypothetical protein